MFQLEVLRALHGDALLLHFGTEEAPKLAMVDGGPSPAWADAVKKRLTELRKERGLPASKPLDIDLLMISHIDDDHVGGLVRFTSMLVDEKASGNPLPYRLRAAWHNAFDDILGNQKAAVTGASMVASLTPAALSKSLVLASVPQGRQLRDDFKALGVKVNAAGTKGLMTSGSEAELGNLSFTVVAPSGDNLAALQAEWDKKLKSILKKKGAAEASLELAAYVDESVYNLSSIVVLVEGGGKRILLTGDARGDHTLQGLKDAKLLKKGAIHVDVLKLPHHGSIRNVDLDYFKAIRADHYIASADGKYDNPDVETLELISKARPDDDFTIHLTYPTDDFKYPEVGKAIRKFYDRERKKGRTWTLETREADALSFMIDLE